MRRFKFLRNPAPIDSKLGVADFLRELDGPTCIYLDGLDPTRTRAFVTLLHGNEPSGIRALLRWLQSGQRAAVNIVCIVASVTAALEAPLFSHRMRPGDRDLNRCFQQPFIDEEGMLAAEVLEILHLHHPETVLDMHNTSGTGPAFGVCTFRDPAHDALTALFSPRIIVSALRLGALMECSEIDRPIVTVEVGGRMDESADELAYAGLCEYFLSQKVFSSHKDAPPMELYHHPMRLEMRAAATLTYAAAPEAGYDVTLRLDIDRLNFGIVEADTQLGWVAADADRPLLARDGDGDCELDQLIRIEKGTFYTARALKLFMVTTDVDIARADCLFYAVAESDHIEPGED